MIFFPYTSSCVCWRRQLQEAYPDGSSVRKRWALWCFFITVQAFFVIFLDQTSTFFSPEDLRLGKNYMLSLRTHVISGGASDTQNWLSWSKNQEYITSCGIWRVLKSIVLICKEASLLKDWSFVDLRHDVLVLRSALLANKTWDEMLLVNAVVVKIF